VFILSVTQATEFSFSVFVLSRKRLCEGPIPHPRSPTNCLEAHNFRPNSEWKQGRDLNPPRYNFTLLALHVKATLQHFQKRKQQWNTLNLGTG
jgi:hypothetical protein